jgi:hypothetical protein
MTNENDEMKMAIMDVTPAMAERWLKRNAADNRPIVWPRVEGYASDMREGNWALNHQGICFNGKGELVDGQHRLHAVLSAQTTVRMLVFTNQAAKYTDPVDRGRPRAIGTILHLRTSHVAALGVLRLFEIGVIVAGKTAGSVADTEASLEHHRVWLDRVCANGGAGLTGGIIGGLIWAYPLSPALADRFLNQVATGEMLKAGDPAYQLRKWREAHSRASAMETALATCNAIRYAFGGSTMAGIFVGESGYRALTTQRRAKGVPFTPSASIVKTLVMKDSRINGTRSTEPEQELWSPALDDPKLGQ